jgi:hypothetical protein
MSSDLSCSDLVEDLCKLELDFFPAIAQTLEHFTKLPKHTYTRPEEADVTSLLNSICNFDFVVL